MELTDIEEDKIIKAIKKAKTLKYATLKIEIQNCKVVAIEVTEKIRF